MDYELGQKLDQITALLGIIARSADPSAFEEGTKDEVRKR